MNCSKTCTLRGVYLDYVGAVLFLLQFTQYGTARITVNSRQNDTLRDFSLPFDYDLRSAGLVPLRWFSTIYLFHCDFAPLYYKLRSTELHELT